VEPFGTLQVGVPGRQTPTWPRIDGQPGAVGIEPSACVVEVGPNLVRLPAVEPRSLELRAPRKDPRRYDSERDVGAVLPVMGDRRQRIISRGRPVRESHRAQRRLADRGEVEREPEIASHRAFIEYRELHEEIVGVLAIMQRRALVGLPRLHQQWVAPAADGPRLGAEHRPQLELTAAQRPACSRHSPIDDPQLVAASRASLPVVLKKSLPVQHEGPTPEHVVGGVHRGGVGQPGGARPHPRLRNAEWLCVHRQGVLHVHLRSERRRGAGDERQSHGHGAAENPSHINSPQAKVESARRSRDADALHLGIVDLGLRRRRKRWGEVRSECRICSQDSAAGRTTCGDRHLGQRRRGRTSGRARAAGSAAEASCILMASLAWCLRHERGEMCSVLVRRGSGVTGVHVTRGHRLR
jgi:hypothetical protein